MTEVKPLKFERILLTVDEDDSESTQRAFRFAVTQAKTFGAELSICSVLENNDINIYDSLTPDKMNEKRNQLKEVVSKYTDEAKTCGVKVTTPIISIGGSIVDEILDSIIPKVKPDLLVVGSNANGEHGNASTSVRLVKRSTISTIIVR